VPSKSTGHRKTGEEPKEVKEKPMAMVRGQDKQWRAAAKSQRKANQIEQTVAIFSLFLYFVFYRSESAQQANGPRWLDNS
jgi:hypothetical protein